MSDTEQSKKRKLEEVAATATDGVAVAVTSEPPATATATALTSDSAAAERENNIVTLQLAKEKQRIVKLLEPFSREQLIAILASAASQFSSISDEIKAVASADVAHRKIFVRGLAWETTSETLKSAFSSFGLVEEAAVIYDKATSKSKGYGFVTFGDMDAAQRAVDQQNVDIDGRRATCNLAALRAAADEHHGPASHAQHRPGGAPTAVGAHSMYAPASAATQMYAPPQQQHAAGGGGYSDESERKLFVRGLSWNTTDDLFHAEFSKFGELEEAMIARDRATGKSKGFGFITFRHKASADLALQQPQKIIDGRTTTCNLASQGGARAGGGAMGGYGGMAQMMPAAVQSYAMPMYAGMPGQYAPPQMQQQQQPVQYGAYPGMAAADPYHTQSYSAVTPQYYAPPGQQPPPRS